MYVNFNILNQLGSPSLNSNTFANRPAAGQTGRLFISTDTFEIYRDNGTGWDLIGTGTGGGITGSGTANQVTYWTGTSAVGGESAFTYNPTTNALRVDGTMSMSIDSSWGLGTSALQMQYGSFAGASTSSVMTYNVSYTSSDFRYIKNDVGIFYSQDPSGHTWSSAAAGSPGSQYSGTLNMRLDTSSRLGVNAVPSDWQSGYKVIQLPNGNTFYASNTGQIGGLSSNAYLDNVGLGSWIYTATNTAQHFEMNAGVFNWYTAPSGTSGNAVTFTKRMILDSKNILALNSSVISFWNASKGVQLGNACTLFNDDSSNLSLYQSNNMVGIGGGSYRYVLTGPAAWYRLINQTHAWGNAPNGSGGALLSQTTYMALYPTGNLGIGTSSDAGQRLQVVGAVSVTGGVTQMAGNGATSATFSQLNFDNASTRLFAVRNDGFTFYGNGNNVAVAAMNTTTLSNDKNGSGILFQMGLADGTGSLFVINGNASAFASGNLNVLNVIKNFAPTSGTATYANTLISPTINQTGGANGITRGLYVNPTLTAAADWRSVEMSNNSGWGIYQSGASANNYFNGDVLVGTTTDSGFKFDVNGSTRLNGTFRVDGQTAATAGGASGQHLIINCDGTTYKIALLNN